MAAFHLEVSVTKAEMIQAERKDTSLESLDTSPFTLRILDTI